MPGRCLRMLVTVPSFGGGARGGGQTPMQFPQKITYNSRLLNYRRQLRANMTKSETVLWKHLKSSQLNYKSRRQYSVGNFIADFACAKIKLIIEVDGLTHADEKIFNKDQIKQKFFKDNGYTIKRYSSEQVFKQVQDVLGDIFQTCEELSKQLPSPS